jgi:hypothetical protein
MRIAKFSHDAQLQLGGWANDKVHQDYGNGLPADELLKSMEKLSYKDLDISHLYLKEK